MVAYLTDSQHWSGYELEREKAWHLLSILLSIGRPARPAELAARCRLFNASGNIIRFLCSVPDSPLLLRDGLFVTISAVGFSAVGGFMSNVVRNVVSPIGVKICVPRGLLDGFRKRKMQEEQASFLFPIAKRRLILPSQTDEGDEIALSFTPTSIKVPEDISTGTMNNMKLLGQGMSIIDHNSKVLSSEISMVPLVHDTNVAAASNVSVNDGYVEDSDKGETEMITLNELPENVDMQDCHHISSNTDENFRVGGFESGLEATLSMNTMKCSLVHKENLLDETKLVNGRGVTLTICLEAETQHHVLPVETGDAGCACKSLDSRIVKLKTDFDCEEEETSIKFVTPTGTQANIPTDTMVQTLLKNDLSSIKKIKPVNNKNSQVEHQPLFPLAELSAATMQPTKSSAKPRSTQRDSLTLGTNVNSSMLDNSTAIATKQQEQYKKDQKGVSMKEKLKNLKKVARDNKSITTSTGPKKHLDAKSLPDFESFIIEEEEGSGGYGTVYRSRRKSDGKTFAIKSPHENAHIHHVLNEMKMLELFGGQNFVIKFEGSFKRNNSECFVLEHVEHDRPEVLKKEIDILQIQWYGYCLFRALASLHKQGVAHRDIKPGNFLFSRKLNKGYLIDFNLAVDLHKKHGITSKSKTFSRSFNHVPLPSAESTPPTNEKKGAGSRVLESVHREIAKSSKLAFEPKSIKKRAEVGPLNSFPDIGSRSIFKSQGADGSGITSTKDATSARTPSGERLRQPRPYSSRKELNRLVQEAMGSPNQKAVRIPASQMKRVAAPIGKMERKLYLTPMPLHCSGTAVSGAGLLKNKGDGKHKKEGPCVGTKGFRAPEVLFRSLHQGFKVDIWSAGVTLLYLMIGRTPFTGDPEQNIKDISKLKGSEDLWEVAKLHNRESSFPGELFDTQSLPSLNLRDWCEMNTKRPEFLDMIPTSLFDLVEKCLTVNPRLRISADEALRHEFFTRCHEDLRKKRLTRKGVSLDSGSAHPLDRSAHKDLKVLHKENITQELQTVKLPA